MAQDQAPEIREIDLRAILGLLRRQITLIAACVLAIVGVTALFVFSLTPKFTAEALVLVEASQSNLLDPQNAFGNASLDSSAVESAVEIVRATSTLLNVIRTQDLVNDPEFGVSLGFRAWLSSIMRSTEVQLPSGQEALQTVLTNFTDALSVNRRGLTSVLSIAVESTSADKAARLANAVAEAYISDQVDAKISAALAARDVLRRRIDLATRSLTESEQAIDNFVFDNVDRIADETGRLDITNLRDEISRLQTQLEQSDQLAAIVASRLQAQDWESLRTSLESEAYQALESQRLDLEARLAGLDASSQEAIDLRASLAELSEQLTSAARVELSNLRVAATQAQGLISDTRTQIRTTALNADLPADILTSIYSLQQESSVARNQYQVLLARLSDVEAQADLQLADARIVSPAIAPPSPSSPRVMLILAVAGFFSLGVGVGAAWLRENYIGGFVTDRQVESVLRIPVAAQVPRLRSSTIAALANSNSPADAIVVAPISQFSESIRRIRAAIDQAVREAQKGRPESRRGIVVMVCSEVPAEGKSTIALSLGRSFAVSGKSTILIDCDLRKPSIHRHLGIQPSDGLYEYLSGEGGAPSITEVVIQDDLTPLAVTMGARRSSTPTDHLVISAAFENLVESAAASFQVVILDAPPIGAVVDGLYLAKHADVIAFVIRWASTSQEDIRAGLQVLDSHKSPTTRILAVLNDVAGGPSSYDKRYTGYFEDGE